MKNGDFSQWNDNGAPLSWHLEGEASWRVDRVNTFQGKQSLMLDVNEGAKSGFAKIYQDMELAPNQEHELRLALSKAGTGKVTITIYPLVNGEPVSVPAPPLAWDNVWSWRFPWTPVQLKFKTTSHTQYRIVIITHAYAGAPTWIENVRIESVVPVSKSVSTFYTQSLMLPFDKLEPPSPDQRISALEVSAIRGEYEPAFLGYRSATAQTDVDLRMKGALVHSSGAEIAGENVSIRMVDDQALLPLSRPRNILPGENLGWWITVKIPEESQPGLYKGELLLTGRNGVISTVGYEVEVEKFILPALDIPAFVYHNEAYFPGGDYLTSDLRKTYYRDMKEHGMTTVTIYNTPGINKEEIDFSRDYKYDALTPEKLEEAKKRNTINDEEWENRLSFGLEQVMDLVHSSGLGDKKFPVVWLGVQEGRHGFGDMPNEILTGAVAKWLNNPKWPEPLLYVLDEPDGKQDRIDAAKRALTRIKSLDLPIKTVTAGVPPKELGDDYDIWIQADHKITEKMLQESVAHDADLWVYNCNMPNHHAIFPRILFGFWAYRTEVKGIGLWAYYDARNWYVDKEGKVHGKSQLSRICLSPDGPIPTTSWESVREGINDYRHSMLFDQLLKTAETRLEAGRQGIYKVVAREKLDRWYPSKRPEAAQRQAFDKEIASLPTVERQAVESYQKLQPLAEMIDACKMVRDRLIDGIPYDAMVPMTELPWSEANAQFVPVIGLGDAHLVPEVKRASMRAYIRQLAHLLEKDEASTFEK